MKAFVDKVEANAFKFKLSITHILEISNSFEINLPNQFTLVDLGNMLLDSSQCIMDARPPAEHPERRA